MTDNSKNIKAGYGVIVIGGMYAMKASLRYPIGIQTFDKIIEGGFVYADKTGYIYRLLNGSNYYFLSRPRRFGKSLFLSTLEAYFLGKRELFRGLELDSYEDVDWSPRPVVKLAFNGVRAESKENLDKHIEALIYELEGRYEISNPVGDFFNRLSTVLKTAFEKTGRKVAVLIDEYDAPLLSTIHKPELNESYRETLKSLFTVLKTADEYIEFAFITGVSRFSHTSLFSGANNLKDISMTDGFAAICGITEQELRDSFMPGIRDLAGELAITEPEAMQLLKDNYDGYHFSKKCPDIYNPFSLLGALDDREIKDYWFQSGTPTYLLNVLRQADFHLPELDCIEAVQSDLSVKESYQKNPVALLFETGYVTIKDYDPEKGKYTLGLPNREVAMSFSKALIPEYSGMEAMQSGNLFIKMRDALIDGEPELFLDLMRTFMEGNPYSNAEMRRREDYFKNNIYILLRAMGFEPQAERQTCRARMDLYMQTRRYIYVFELKTGGSADAAMRQIMEKGYALPFRHSGRKVIRIAASYDPATNNIDGIVEFNA